MADQTGDQGHPIMDRVKALDRKDFAFLSFYLLMLSAVGAYFAWLTLEQPGLGAGQVRLMSSYHSQILYGVIGLLVLIDIMALRHRRALFRARDEVLKLFAARDTAGRMALIDEITGTFNKRYLDQILPVEKSRADRTGTSLTFMVTSIDDFPKITVDFGAQTGEHVLKELAQMLKTVLRPTDIIVRYGNEEFLIVMPSTSKHGALAAVKRLLTDVDAWNRASMIPGVVLKLSFGLGDYSHKGDINEVLASARQRVTLYREKGFSAELGA